MMDQPVEKRLIRVAEGFGLKDYVYQPNAPIEYAYFPVDGNIAVATVGNEEMIGLPLFLGERSQSTRDIQGHLEEIYAVEVSPSLIRIF